MKISIITVAYNSEATIADTLRSVAEQTYTDIEHIVVDGASSDKTMDIVHEYGSHVSKLLSEPDRGIYDAMNKGLQLATGDMIGFLNADDFFSNAHTVAEIAGVAANSNVDVIYGDLIYVDGKCPNKVVRYWRSGEFKRSRLRFGWMPPHPTLYVRKSNVEKCGFFDAELRVAADYDFILRYLGRGNANVAYIPKVLVHMRAGGVSNQSVKMLIRKSREDLFVLRRNGIGGWPTLLCKNFRKIPQFITSRAEVRL